MPVDAQTQAVLDELNVPGHPPYHTVTPETLRSLVKLPSGPAPEMFKVEERPIPGPAGDITIRVYIPSEGGHFPLLVWYHGGGWVIGDLDMTDGSCRRLAVGAQCVVASVDYRLAPEHKFPAAAEDCYAATAWLAKNAASINADGSRVAVGGASAGGNLAAVVPNHGTGQGWASPRSPDPNSPGDRSHLRYQVISGGRRRAIGSPGTG